MQDKTSEVKVVNTRKKSEMEGLIVSAEQIRTHPDQAKEILYTSSYVDLQEQKKQIGEVLALMHAQILNLLADPNPRARLSIAEYMNSYAMVHNVSIAIERQLIDTTHKEVDLKKKIEVDNEEVLDPFKMQRLFKEVQKIKKKLEQKSSGELPEPVISETKDISK
jgi:hypothetical protein